MAEAIIELRDRVPHLRGRPRAIDISAGPRALLAQLADLARELTGARGARIRLERTGSVTRTTRDLVAVRLVDGRGDQLGVLRVSHKPGGFSPSDVAIVKLLARLASDLVVAALGYRRAMRAGEKLSALVRSAPVAMVEMDQEGHCLVWNPASERLFGWAVDDVIGRTCPAVPERLRLELVSVLARVFRGETVLDLETVRERKDGSLIDVLVSVAPVRSESGAIVGALACIADPGEARLLRRQLDRLRFGMLSTRERDVVRLLREGCSYRGIATELRLSEGTVRTLVHRAYRKLDVHSRNELPALS